MTNQLNEIGTYLRRELEKTHDDIASKEARLAQASDRQMHCRRTRARTAFLEHLRGRIVYLKKHEVHLETRLADILKQALAQ